MNQHISILLLMLWIAMLSGAAESETALQNDARWNLPMEGVAIADPAGGSGYSIGCKTYDNTVKYNVDLLKALVQRDVAGIPIPQKLLIEIILNDCIVLSDVSYGAVATEPTGRNVVFVSEAYPLGGNKKENLGWYYFFDTQLWDRDGNRLDQR